MAPSVPTPEGVGGGHAIGWHAPAARRFSCGYTPDSADSILQVPVLPARRSILILLLACCVAAVGVVTVLLLGRADRQTEIVVLAGDLRNGGVLGVVLGIEEACDALGWQMTVFDLGRSDSGRSESAFADGYRRAFERHPRGLVLVSGNIRQPEHAENLARAEKLGIPVVGWHVAPEPGPVPNSPVLFNVTTPSEAVADAAAALVVPKPDEPDAGIVVFTDTGIQFAHDKSDRMLAFLETCDRCTVLEVEDIPLAETAVGVPPAVRRLLATYGDRWTHSLAINDLYFDHAIHELVAGDGPPPRNVSAGDGSPSAMLRIRYQSFQYASVAEPLLQQGWELVDELHRAFHGEPPSRTSNPAWIVTSENVARVIDDEGFLEPDFPYREEYVERWSRASDE